MIGKFRIHHIPDHSEFRHATNLGFGSLTFAPGLNVVVGPNASGKSTLLRMLAAGCYALDNGYPLLSVSALQEHFDFDGHDRLDGIEVAHDGQVCYASSVESNRAQSDGAEGLLNTYLWGRGLARMSAGEAVAARFDLAYQILLQEIDPERYFDLDAETRKRLRRFKNAPSPEKLRGIQSEIKSAMERKGRVARVSFPSARDEVAPRKTGINQVYQARYAKAVKRFTPSLSPSKPTLLLDEPDAHLELALQVRVWRMLTHPKVLDRYQIIVATHSLCAWHALACGVDANVIEMRPGFFREVAGELAELMTSR